MTIYGKCEKELQLRQVDWWDRLVEIIPELDLLVGTPQPPEYHAEGDVATHTRLAVEACPPDCDPDLFWVALLHDIGKPETTEKHEDGRITAYGHAKYGALVAELILVQLDMPEERRKRIVWVIRHHMFHHSWQLKSAKKLTNKQRTYLTSPDFPLLLEFLRVDSAASHGKADAMQAYEFYKKLLQTTVSNGS